MWAEASSASGSVIEIRFPIIDKAWITTTQELSERVLKESEVFTRRKDGGSIAGLRRWMPDIICAGANMLTMDEPDHTRLRGYRRRTGLPLVDRPKFMAWTNSFSRLTSLVGLLGLKSERHRRSLLAMPSQPAGDRAQVVRRWQP